jgi:hypothetical protein
MALPERKNFELKQKLQSLELEFEMWRIRSEPGQPFEKHHTQIRRITHQMDGYREIIQEKLQSAIGKADEFLEENLKLQKQILELHRIWEFFRSKFVLRSLPWFSDYLVAADEFAWKCYRAAQEKVSAQHVAPEAIKEPPLVFFNGGSSPFSMRRKLVYQAEEVPREALQTVKFFELLKDLPIPLIGIPWFQIQYLPDALVIGHEVGHIVRHDLRLQATTEALLVQGMKNGKVAEERQTAWFAWLDEMFADIYGNLATGPAFVGSLIDFVAMDKNDVMQEQPSSLNWGTYPTVYLRVLLNLQVLRMRGFKSESDQMEAEWKAMFDSHAMPEFVDDIEKIVESLVSGQYAEFGDAPLTSVLSFSPPNQLHTIKAAESLLDSGPIGDIDDVRELYAAARWAFAQNADGYTEKNVQSSILNRILATRKPGFREDKRDTESLFEQDKAAGRALFQKMEVLLSREETYRT